ncbi:helix-hairpin-helix domain-containing protein [bacterium]|nr:helix-hairpin-helix domain-containing protein [bacterium]
MILTQLEKVTFGFLLIALLLGLFLVFGQVKIVDSQNEKIEQEILKVQSLTPKKPLVKGKLSAKIGGKEINKININTATLAQLDSLPGVGKAFAEKLISYRKERGKFNDMSELSEMPGVSAKKLSAVSRFLCVNKEEETPTGAPKKLNLNFASLEELDALPGVGKTLAEAIIETRRQKGSFQSLEDLEDVPGLSERTFKKFSDQVDVR